MHRFTRRSAVATMAAGWLALAAPSVQGASDPTFRVAYDIYFGGLHLAVADASVSLTGARYVLGLRANLRGISSVFSSWRLETNSRGAVNGSSILPDAHTLTQARGGDADSVRMRFDSGRPVDVVHTPEREEPAPGHEDFIPESELQGALDPVSALILAMQTVENAQSCQMRAPVYDGRRRFDLVFSSLGSENLEATRYNAYSGPATRCRVHIELVSGAFSAADSDSFWSRGADRSDRQMDVWFGRPLSDGPVLPVRLQGDTRFGRFLIHLREAGSIGQ
ncbi:DUF3108 domain-containing protein [Fodinicurvata sp. EGI_FJ10296]|uniref:DUF3108 domain-containing protein n=1 Tax=Fodinicurvata sp. EGI_FJ10296 TaxID=3231908 RepID=UPI003455FB93